MSSTRDAVRQRYRAKALQMANSGGCGDSSDERCGAQYRLMVETDFEAIDVEITNEQSVDGLCGAIGSAAIRVRKPVTGRSQPPNGE